MFKKRLRIPQTRVPDVGLRDFPILVRFADPALRVLSKGGQVADAEATGIYFTSSDDHERLAHEIASYDPSIGQVVAWVRMPCLSPETDTQLTLWCDPHGGTADREPGQVWDDGYMLVLHLDNASKMGREEPIKTHASTGSITVEAWVFTDRQRAETIQPLVSAWCPLSSFERFAAYDAGHTDGLRSEAYFGATFDGQYVYFAPQHYEDKKAHGIVLRYDTHAPFHDPASYQAYDAGDTDGLRTRGFYGAMFDGRYVHFVPRQDEDGYHSRALRYDTQMNFKEPGAWEAYDVGEEHSQQGVAFDGRYIYYSPGFAGDAQLENVHSSRVMRYDTRAPFKDPTSWRVYDANTGVDPTRSSPGVSVGCFDGAGFDGRYIYFAPLNYGTALRYDTKGDFGDSASWQACDWTALGLGTCVGVVFDGRFVYYVPYAHGTVVRYDSSNEFSDVASWRAYDAGATDGLNTNGFDGGFFDGRYVYFIPFVGPPWTPRPDGRRRYTFHANFLRYDAGKPFDDPASWDAHDASTTDGIQTLGYNGGAFDGRFFYLAPWQDGTPTKPMHGRILRYDTLGEGSTFSLRYSDCGHNGGLCAAVPGPSFLVNTERGALSVAAHEVLRPGWHYLAGVYNGRSVKLFVDGRLVAERPGSGKLQDCCLPVTVGYLQDSVARFDGEVREVRVSTIARHDDWIKTQYRNLIDPAGFVEVDRQECFG